MSRLRDYCEEVVEIGRKLLQDVDDNKMVPAQRMALFTRLDTLAFCIREHESKAP